MGGYLAVQQGSKYPPQFIHLIYSNPTVVPNSEPIKRIALIGKGLTFDSGGYNLKVNELVGLNSLFLEVGATSQIEMMKYDMGGCAAVLGCARAIAEIQPEVTISYFSHLTLIRRTLRFILSLLLVKI